MITAARAVDVGAFLMARVGEHPRRWRERDGVVRAVREAHLAATGALPLGGTWLWRAHRATWLGADAVVRVARVDYGETALARDLWTRGRINGDPATTGWSRMVATTRWSGHCAGHFAEVEDRLPGTSLLELLSSRGAARSVEEELAEVHRTTGHWVVADDNRLMCWLLGPAVNVAHVLRRWGRVDLAEAVTRWARQTTDVLRGQRCRVYLVHGDLWPRNVLVQHGRLAGVVDWDRAGFHDAALHDVLHFTLVPAALVVGADLGELVSEALTDNRGRGSWGGVLRCAAFRDSRREMGLSARDALTWYWLRYSARVSLEPGRANHPRWVARNLVAVASVLKNGNRK